MSHFAATEVFKLVLEGQWQFFFERKRGDSVSGGLVPHPPALAQAAPTLCSGFWTGLPVTTPFDTSVLLLKKKQV